MKKIDRNKQISEMIKISELPKNQRPGEFSKDVKRVIDENQGIFEKNKGALVAYGVSYYEGDFCVIVYTKIGKGKGIENEIPDELGKYKVYYEEIEDFIID